MVEKYSKKVFLLRRSLHTAFATSPALMLCCSADSCTICEGGIIDTVPLADDAQPTPKQTKYKMPTQESMDSPRETLAGDEEGDRFYSVGEAPPEISSLTAVGNVFSGSKEMTQRDNYMATAEAAIEALWRMHHAQDWHYEKDISSHICSQAPSVAHPHAHGKAAVRVSSRKGGAKGGKVWMAEALLPFPAEAVAGLIRECETTPVWNNSVEKYTVVEQLNEVEANGDGTPRISPRNGGGNGNHKVSKSDSGSSSSEMLTDITYTRAKAAAGGTIAARDFVDVRAFGIRAFGQMRSPSQSQSQSKEQEQLWAYVLGRCNIIKYVL